MKKRKIVIIGNGISGVTCARHLRKGDEDCEIIVISGETKHFFSRTALMYIYMGHMKYEHTKPYEDGFWEKNRIQLVEAWVDKVDFKNKQLQLKEKEHLDYDELILATGSKPNKFGWKGQDLKGVQGLYSLQDLQLMEANTQNIKRAVVVGGGLIGIEMAEMLSTRDIPVTFLVREKGFWDNILPKEEADLVGRHIVEHHIDLRLETELSEILEDGSGKVKGVKTNSGEVISCEFVGLAVGVSPNIEFLKETDLDINRGILIDESFKTNIPDVYAIGDCAEFKQAPAPDRKNIEQVWYTGRMHGETLAYGLLKGQDIPYRPGIWFNSAKFLDIEYQTYGQVPTQPAESFYWEHENGKVCLRLVFDPSDRKILGVNSFGWRLRHAFFEEAITGGWDIERVLCKLPEADFNAEFHEDFHKSVLKAYQLSTGKQLKTKKRSFMERLIGNRA